MSKKYKSLYKIKVDGKFDVKFKLGDSSEKSSIVDKETSDIDLALHYIEKLKAFPSSKRHNESLSLFLKEFKELASDSIRSHNCLEYDGMFYYSIVSIATIK